MDDLLSEFLTETTENLSVLDLELVKLEQNPNDPALLSNIFRLVHTIKGTCGFLGLPRLEAVAHAGENVLGKIRDGELAVTPTAISLILESLDCVKSIMAALEATEAEPAGDNFDLINRLNAFASGEAAAAAPKAAAPKAAKAKAPAAKMVEAPQAAEFETVEAPVVAEAAPEVAPSAVAEPAEGKTVAAAPVAETAEVAEEAPAPAARQAESKDSAVAGQSIRVNVDLLENLMTMVSELVLTRNQLHADPAQPEGQRVHDAAAAALARHDRAAGGRHEDAHAADRQCLGEAAAPGPRSVARTAARRSTCACTAPRPSWIVRSWR